MLALTTCLPTMDVQKAALFLTGVRQLSVQKFNIRLGLQKTSLKTTHYDECY